MIVASALPAPAMGEAAVCDATVTEGTLRGTERAGACVFRGVRYAAAPVGDLRFRPPAPPPRWDGVRELDVSSEFVCPRVAPNVTESYAGRAPDPVDEDCLRLSVTAPSQPGSGRPVLVYLHGGGFVSGSGFQADFDPQALVARGDVVVVTVNYRLGVFGYLELGGVSGALAGSGNNGLRDQMAALRWVRENARAFGGDPDAITVMGQSAGAISIAAMLAGPAPERLFRRAILQSGTGYLVQTRRHAERLAGEVLRTAGARSADDLRAMPADRLLDVQRRVLARRPISRSLTFGPHVDGDLVPAPVLDRMAAGSARRVDLLVGTNADEAGFFALGRPTLAFVPPELNPFLPAALARRRLAMAASYRRSGRPQGAIPRARDSALLRMVTDQLFQVPAIRTADLQAQAGGRVAMYRFDWRAAARRDQPWLDVGAVHCLEIPFVFGGLRLDWLPGGAGRRIDAAAAARLSERMMDAWLAFARTGEAPWQAYEPTRRATMVWSGDPRVVHDPAAAERRLWEGYDFRAFAYPWPWG